MIYLKPFYLIISILSIPLLAYNQDEIIKIKNGSFECEPQRGGDKAMPLKGWFDCGQIDFPSSSTPDIHGKDTDFWNVEHDPSDGETFLGLVVREGGEYESIAQRL